MYLRGAVLVAGSVASAALADIKRHEFIPDSFRGSWATGAEGCATGSKSVVAFSSKAYDRQERQAIRTLHQMRIAGGLLVLVLLGSSIAMADIKRHEFIPEALRGSWAAGAGGCDAGNESAIVLSAKDYQRGEEKCTVEWVSETAGPVGPIYSAYLRCSRQPGGGTPAFNLIMRPEGANRVAIGTAFDNLSMYQKCAAKQ